MSIVYIFFIVGTMMGAALAYGGTILPIEQVEYPSGSIRYSVNLTVSNSPLIAMLDTGSVGLRVMPGAIPSSAVHVLPIESNYHYGNGVLLRGYFGQTAVGFGTQNTDSKQYIQLVTDVDCVWDKPKCPAPQIRQEGFRMFSEGYPNMGYRAILGVGLRGAGISNPLLGIGNHTWIIELPRPGDKQPGHLIIDPTSADRFGFRMYALEKIREKSPIGPVDGWDDVIRGCLIVRYPPQTYCGPAFLDTGAPFIQIVRADARSLTRWSITSAATMQFDDHGHVNDSVDFVLNADPGGRVWITPPTNIAHEGLRMGTLPYYRYLVLYDAKAGAIGLKLRPK
jgi:hypothetical protein